MRDTLRQHDAEAQADRLAGVATTLRTQAREIARLAAAISTVTAQRDAAVADLETLRRLIDVHLFDDGTYAVGISAVHWQAACELLSAAPGQQGAGGEDALTMCPPCEDALHDYCMFNRCECRCPRAEQGADQARGSGSPLLGGRHHAPAS